MVKNSPQWVEINSHAKVNLMLDVVEKRPDGYHNIISLFQEISFHDTFFVSITKEPGILIESTKPLPENNTLKIAYEIFKEKAGIDWGIKVKLIKRIPMGGGLGGGSSNAAALLKFLAEKVGMDEIDLMEIASFVGSDVPFFIKGGTAVVSGKGEIIESLDPLPPYGITLFTPEVRIDTSFAYKVLREKDFGKAPCTPWELYQAYKDQDLEKIKKCSYNIFHEIMLQHYWELNSTLKVAKKAPDAIVSLMTGSGSTIFTVHPPGRGTFSFGRESKGTPHLL